MAVPAPLELTLKLKMIKMDVEYLAYLPPLREMLCVFDLTRLRTSTKSLHQDTELLRLQEQKRQQLLLTCNIPMLARFSEPGYKEKRDEILSRMTILTFSCFFDKKCEVCLKRCRNRKLNPYAEMFGHARCVQHKFASRYFPKESEIAIVASCRRGITFYNDKDMRHLKERFGKVRSWLDAPSNKQYKVNFENEILETVCNARGFRKVTILKNTLQRLAYMSNMTIPEDGDVFSKLQRCKEGYRALCESRNKREKNLKWSLAAFQLNRHTSLSRQDRTDLRMWSDEYIAYGHVRLTKPLVWGDILEKRYSTVDTAAAFMLSAIHKNWRRSTFLMFNLEIQFKFPWMDMLKKRMRLWRGVSRFIGKMAVQIGGIAPPRKKQRLE